MKLFIASEDFNRLANDLADNPTRVTTTVSTQRSAGCVEIVASEELTALRAKVRGLTNKVAELTRRLRSATVKLRRVSAESEET